MEVAKPLQQKAYDHLKHMILNDQFEYNNIYSETKVSKEIGISRTPVRDAIHRLAQEGYLDIIPSKGFCIHQLTEQDIIETFQVRSAIEGYCITQLTKDCTSPKREQLFKTLKLLLEKQKNIMENTHSIKEFAEYDNMFHMEIVAYMGNTAFNELFSSYLYKIKRLALLSLSHQGRMEETYKEHCAIYEAMKSGDMEHIYDITMEHMERPRSINLSDLL